MHLQHARVRHEYTPLHLYYIGTQQPPHLELKLLEKLCRLLDEHGSKRKLQSTVTPKEHIQYHRLK